MDTLDTSAAPVYRFDIHPGAIHARNAWVLMPKILRSSESAGKKPTVKNRYPLGFWLISNVNISVVDLKLYARFIIYESTKALWVGFWTYAPLLIDEKPRTIKDEVFLRSLILPDRRIQFAGLCATSCVFAVQKSSKQMVHGHNNLFCSTFFAKTLRCPSTPLLLYSHLSFFFGAK